jgi:hypothetical protein
MGRLTAWTCLIQPFRDHPEIRIPFLFYKVPWSNPVLGPTIFTDRFWDEREHWLTNSVGVCYDTTRPWFGPIPAPTVGPQIGTADEWQNGLDYEKWINGGYGFNPCWPTDANRFGLKIGLTSLARVNPGADGEIDLELGFTSKIRPFLLIGEIDLELGFTSVVKYGPALSGHVGLQLGFRSTWSRPFVVGKAGLQLGFRSTWSLNTYAGKIGLEPGFRSTLLSLEAGFTSNGGPIPRYKGLVMLDIGFEGRPASGVNTPCCSNSIPPILLVVMDSGERGFIYWNEPGFWTGSVNMTCGGTLQIKFGCVFGLFGWVLTLALSWDGTSYLVDLSQVGNCASPWFVTHLYPVGGVPPGTCTGSVGLSIY